MILNRINSFLDFLSLLNFLKIIFFNIETTEYIALEMMINDSRMRNIVLVGSLARLHYKGIVIILSHSYIRLPKTVIAVSR